MTLNPADQHFLEQFPERLRSEIFRAPEPRYLEEPRGRWQGKAGLLALPRDTNEVSQLVQAAHAARVPVVPFGGGTGLVGGQISPDGPEPLLISLERMNAVKLVSPSENVLICEAGVTLADAQQAAKDADRLFPLSLASEGTARIGGVLATNAGGTGVLRYGNARDLCLGVEAVMADGSIWSGLTRLRKDNTGYDLRNLLIGSEGTLGIITAATLKLYPRPTNVGTAFFIVPSPDAALALLSIARDLLGEAVSAFELIHRQGFEFLSETLPEIRLPFAEAPEWCVLIEVGLSAGQDAQDALADVFEAAENKVIDGLIAQSDTQSAEFWSVREHIPEANRRIGSVSSHDISVPLSAVPEFIQRGRDAVAKIGSFRINCFGHMGDGNLHYNVFPMPGRTRKDHLVERDQIKRVLHDLVHDMGGSVSAEHGIGRLKVDDLERYGDPVKLRAMRGIKSALDPRGILNPGAVLRQEGS